MNRSLDSLSRVHLVGIGGAGMEGLARLLAARGCRVSGSDRADSPAVSLLRQEGFSVQVGHDRRWVEGVDLVVFSAAVPADNPERVAAGELGIETASRAQVLGELSRAPFTVAIAGTHGKTTTASMTAAILRDAGVEPQVVVGGWVAGRPQAEAGRGEVMVVEADEYARSFLQLHPDRALVTSVDAEHLDCYGDIAALERAFRHFLDRLPVADRGLLAGDGLVGDGVRSDRGHRTYGLRSDNDYRIADLEERAWGSRFALCFEGQPLGEIELQVHGVHNARNAAGAAALAHQMEIDFAAISGALGQFKGVDRRYQRKGEIAGVLVIDDYAHHPAELAAVIAAARQSGRRVVAVFQPHLYSRTRDFARDFARELAAADHVVLAEIYASREAPIAGVDSGLIAAAIGELGHESVDYISDRKALVPHVAALCRAGDVVLGMGAGDIGEAVDELVAALGQKEGGA